jgi:hypothetical protein
VDSGVFFPAVILFAPLDQSGGNAGRLCQFHRLSN